MNRRLKHVASPPKGDLLRAYEKFAQDSNTDKIFLGIGAYRDDDGQPWVLPVVREVERKVMADLSQNHEYLWYLGDDKFADMSIRVLLGENNATIAEGRALGIQSISGTGALRVAASFLRQVLDCSVVYFSDPSWENYPGLFYQSGFSDQRCYRYWDSSSRGLDFDGLLHDLREAPTNSVVVLQSCAHNPTGCDPTHEQWVAIADVIEERRLFPLFDTAYQGFASGDLDADAWPVRYFVERGFELMCAQSFSKNMGLYDVRIGCLAAVWQTPKDVQTYRDNMHLYTRTMYLCPPKLGVHIVKAILSDPHFYQQWLQCIKVMSDRVKGVRERLRKRLEELGTPGTWEHITNQIGMFSYTGLTEKQVRYMCNKHHVYLLNTGRANLCGIAIHQVDRVARAIHDAVVQKLEED